MLENKIEAQIIEMPMLTGLLFSQHLFFLVEYNSHTLLRFPSHTRPLNMAIF